MSCLYKYATCNIGSGGTKSYFFTSDSIWNNSIENTKIYPSNSSLSVGIHPFSHNYIPITNKQFSEQDIFCYFM